MVRVHVANTNETLVKWLKTSYGGYVYFCPYENPKWKNRWEWQATGAIALTFLRLVLPYLRLKKPQAELAIKFLESRRGQGKPFTKDEMDLAGIQKIKMNQLNKTGK